MKYSFKMFHSVAPGWLRWLNIRLLILLRSWATWGATQQGICFSPPLLCSSPSLTLSEMHLKIFGSIKNKTTQTTTARPQAPDGTRTICLSLWPRAFFQLWIIDKHCWIENTVQENHFQADFEELLDLRNKVSVRYLEGSRMFPWQNSQQCSQYFKRCFLGCLVGSVR